MSRSEDSRFLGVLSKRNNGANHKWGKRNWILFLKETKSSNCLSGDGQVSPQSNGTSAAAVIGTRDCPENAAEELAVCLARADPNCRKVIFGK